MAAKCKAELQKLPSQGAENQAKRQQIIETMKEAYNARKEWMQRKTFRHTKNMPPMSMMYKYLLIRKQMSRLEDKQKNAAKKQMEATKTRVQQKRLEKDMAKAEKHGLKKKIALLKWHVKEARTCHKQMINTIKKDFNNSLAYLYTQIEETKLKLKKQTNQRNIVPPTPIVRVAPYSYWRDQAKGLHYSVQHYTGRRFSRRISPHVLDGQQSDSD